MRTVALNLLMVLLLTTHPGGSEARVRTAPPVAVPTVAEEARPDLPGPGADVIDRLAQVLGSPPVGGESGVLETLIVVRLPPGLLLLGSALSAFGFLRWRLSRSKGPEPG